MQVFFMAYFNIYSLNDTAFTSEQNFMIAVGNPRLANVVAIRIYDCIIFNEPISCGDNIFVTIKVEKKPST